MIYIFVDPSGIFNEGKGHTGIASITDNDWNTLEYKSIAAKDFKTRFEYWSAIINETLNPVRHKPEECQIIIESFMIRTQGFLIGKMPETIQFIGAYEFVCDMYGLTYSLQTPTQAKSRFKDDDLPRYIPGFEKRPNGRYYLNGKQVNDHIRDALKHLLYFMKYHK
jgi:hypothetical protein